MIGYPSPTARCNSKLILCLGGRIRVEIRWILGATTQFVPTTLPTTRTTVSNRTPSSPSLEPFKNKMARAHLSVEIYFHEKERLVERSQFHIGEKYLSGFVV